MDTQSVQNAYRRYASFYDQVFGRILQPGRELAVKLINSCAPQNTKVLEVGVGTGLSLDLYRADLKITGIDISQEMLDKAQERIQEFNLQTRAEVIAMDAEQLTFPDANFDTVVAMYVASVVPNPEKFLNEITRVCIPQGNILIVNHFASKNTFINAIEKKLAPHRAKLGFHPDFPIETILNYPHFKLIETYRTNLCGYWKLLHLKRN